MTTYSLCLIGISLFMIGCVFGVWLNRDEELIKEYRDEIKVLRKNVENLNSKYSLSAYYKQKEVVNNDINLSTTNEDFIIKDKGGK